MEPDSSLACPQEPATRPYPKPDQSSLCPPSYLFKIHFNIILPFTPFPHISLPRPCVHVSSQPNVPHTTPLIPLDLITQIIFGEEYKSWNSSVWNFLQSSVTSSLLGPNIFLSTQFSDTHSLCSSFLCANLTTNHTLWSSYRITVIMSEFLFENKISKTASWNPLIISNSFI
jgi:hypothetical protein